MGKNDLLDFSRDGLFNRGLSLEELKQEIQQEIETRKNENFIQISKTLPNFMAEIPEQQMLIILIDIVGFSKSSTREQVYDIYLFQRFLMSQVLSSKFDFSKNIHISNFIPTGDGCYIVAEDCDPEIAMKFLVTLIKNYALLQESQPNPHSLRISAEIGTCVPFIDIAKHKNYIGQGMNEAARILAYGQKTLEDSFVEAHPDATKDDTKMYSRNSLYLSEAFRDCADSFQDQCTRRLDFKNVADKHGMTRNIIVLQGIHQ